MISHNFQEMYDKMTNQYFKQTKIKKIPDIFYCFFNLFIVQGRLDWNFSFLDRKNNFFSTKNNGTHRIYTFDNCF